jgi:hypothetical protein
MLSSNLRGHRDWLAGRIARRNLISLDPITLKKTLEYASS